ncbi:unnamed protein product [Gongylonema pulchrum]|uniref:Secreted protein n=1 Tax=Gongylonema pulchrum TaxID=637853 RepID=A0A183EJM1_9BILA|nr:unnamed protein product [Gongylonema pulchrum]
MWRALHPQRTEAAVASAVAAAAAAVERSIGGSDDDDDDYDQQEHHVRCSKLPRAPSLASPVPVPMVLGCYRLRYRATKPPGNCIDRVEDIHF